VFFRNGFKVTGKLKLLRSKIGSNFECDGGIFENPSDVALDADSITVEGSTYLRDGFRSAGEVRLVGAKIGASLICIGGTFDNGEGIALRLVRANISGALFLRSLTIQPIGTVHLGGARVGQLIDDFASWPRPRYLILDGFVYGSLAESAPTDAKRRSDWLNRQPEDQFKPQPYEQLAQVLRQMGHERESRAIAIAKYAALRKRGGLSALGRFWNLFLGVTIRYGYQPALIILWMALFVLAGSWVFSQVYSSCLMAPSKERIYLDKQQFQCSNGIWNLPQEYPRFHAVVYSLDVFFPVVDLQQKAYWQPTDATPKGLAYRGYFWAHTVIGWLLTGVAVAGLARLVKRD